MKQATESNAGLWNQRGARSKPMAASEEQWFLPNTPTDWRSKKMTISRFRPLRCSFDRCCCRVASHLQRSGPYCAQWPPHLGKIVLTPCCRNFQSIICAISKTRVASKTSAWLLVAKLRSVPQLSMECQINDQKSRASPAQTWIALATVLATYNFAASLFCTAQAVPKKILDYVCRKVARLAPFLMFRGGPMGQPLQSCSTGNLNWNVFGIWLWAVNNQHNPRNHFKPHIGVPPRHDCAHLLHLSLQASFSCLDLPCHP